MGNKASRQPQTKKVWTTPQLTVHGPVEKLTGQTIKQFGAADGYTYEGVPIGDVS